MSRSRLLSQSLREPRRYRAGRKSYFDVGKKMEDRNTSGRGVCDQMASGFCSLPGSMKDRK